MREKAPLTYTLIGIFILVFAAELWFQFQNDGAAFRIGGETLFQLGANFAPSIQQGQYWRLLTSCFLHVDGIHLVMNSLAMSYFGPMLERNFGPVRLFLAFVVTGLAGSALSVAMHLQEPYLSAGASGGLYGLFGILFVTGKRYARNLPKEYQVWLNQNVGLLLIFSFVPGIDTWGHFGGFGAGLLIGTFIKPLPPDPQAWGHDEADADTDWVATSLNEEQPPAGAR